MDLFARQRCAVKTVQKWIFINKPAHKINVICDARKQTRFTPNLISIRVSDSIFSMWHNAIRFSIHMRLIYDSMCDHVTPFGWWLCGKMFVSFNLMIWQWECCKMLMVGEFLKYKFNYDRKECERRMCGRMRSKASETIDCSAFPITFPTLNYKIEANAMQ